MCDGREGRDVCMVACLLAMWIAPMGRFVCEPNLLQGGKREAAQIHRAHNELEWITLAKGVSKCNRFSWSESLASTLSSV